MRAGRVGGFMMMAVALMAARGFAEEAGPSGASASGEAEVPPALAADVRVHLTNERASATRALWGWSIVGLGAGTYAGLALAGSAGGGPATESIAWVGTIAGLVGVTRAIFRGRVLSRIDDRLAVDFGRSADRSSVTLAALTRDEVDRELRARLTALRASSRGALRAGCVLPVLLAGIGAYGVSAGGSGGDALAGLGIGGALVIGAPSMLSYVGLQRRMARMEDLVARWDRALAGGRTIRE